MKLLGMDRIANQETMVVHIDPKDRYRYGMKFWINQDNGLMMKSSLIDETNFEDANPTRNGSSSRRAMALAWATPSRTSPVSASVDSAMMTSPWAESDGWSFANSRSSSTQGRQLVDHSIDEGWIGEIRLDVFVDLVRRIAIDADDDRPPPPQLGGGLLADAGSRTGDDDGLAGE